MAKSYLAVRTQLRSYLFEIEGGATGVKKALQTRKGPVGVFSTKSSALQWLESTGLPVELHPGVLQEPQMQACLLQQQQSRKKKVLQ